MNKIQILVSFIHGRVCMKEQLDCILSNNLSNYCEIVLTGMQLYALISENKSPEIWFLNLNVGSSDFFFFTSGTGPGRVVGWTSTDGNRKAVSFTVMWRGGSSVTAWTGLCHVCSGVETIKTTWVLTSDVDTCEEHWSSNRWLHLF